MLEATQQREADLSLLGLEVREVVGAHAVVVADGAAVGHDRLARDALDAAPLLELVLLHVRVGSSAVAVRPGAHPVRRARKRCRGYRATARIMAQVMIGRNGEKIRSQATTASTMSPRRMKKSSKS